MRGRVCQSRWIVGTGHAACVLLGFLALACSTPGEPAPTPTPTTPSPPLPSPPAAGWRLRLSGRVLDENGTPIPRATVEVDYASAGGVSNPPSFCPVVAQFCWLATKTNETGEYSVEFEPAPWAGRGLGYIYALSTGYEVDVQWVPTGASPAVRDLRLRSSRSIQAGQSTVVTVDAASSLCTDLEDNWALGHRCEIVVIASGAGMLNVEARPEAGQPAASMFWYTTGNYAGLITRPSPGTVAIPARGGEYRVLVGVPEGAPSQQFTVTTSLR